MQCVLAFHSGAPQSITLQLPQSELGKSPGMISGHLLCVPLGKKNPIVPLSKTAPNLLISPAAYVEHCGKKMVRWGVQMEAFSLKAPLALSCSFTLFETHQLLEVKYSLCLFPEHLCSWLCTPMSPSAVYSCCPNISQHPSAGVAALGPWSASPLCCCTPQNLPSGFPGCTAPAPFQVGHLTGGVLLQGGEGGWWDMRGDRTARWSLAFLSGQNSHRCDYSPFPKLLVACRRTEFQEMHHLFSS